MPIERSILLTRVAIGLTFYATAASIPEGRGFAQAQPTRKLNIRIIEGEGAINNIKSRTATEAIVQVEDENHRPVGGASVTFTLPNSGPGGSFLNGAKFLTVPTDQSGRAVATGLKPNTHVGKYLIRVSASVPGQTAMAATVTIAQANAMAAVGVTAGAGGIFGIGVPATVAVVGAVVAGAIVGVVKGVNGGGAKTVRVSAGQVSLP